MAYGAILGQKGVSSFNGRFNAVIPQTGDYTAQMVGARPDTWMPTAAQVGAAPAGYGLGIADVDTTDCNQIFKSGWYSVTNALNTPPVGNYGWMLVSSRSGTSSGMIRQDYFSSTSDPLHSVRYAVNGIWQPWEYENPPMQLGVEYRTTERYNGKPVYTKLFDFGYLPVNTFKIVAHNIANVQQILSVTGSPIDGKANIPTQSWMNGYWENNVDLIADKSNIQIVTKDCDNILTETITIYVTLKYTKTTD